MLILDPNQDRIKGVKTVLQPKGTEVLNNEIKKKTNIASNFMKETDWGTRMQKKTGK